MGAAFVFFTAWYFLVPKILVLDFNKLGFNFYNPEHGLNLSNMSASLSACPHGIATLALCSVCSSMAQHFSIISQCTHKWSKLNYDLHFVRNANCDFAGSGGMNGWGAFDSIHQAVNNMGEIAYYCSQCHAISCVNCIAL